MSSGKVCSRVEWSAPLWNPCSSEWINLLSLNSRWIYERECGLHVAVGRLNERLTGPVGCSVAVDCSLMCRLGNNNVFVRKFEEMRQLGDDEKIGSCLEIRRDETTGWWWENCFLFGDPKRWDNWVMMRKLLLVWRSEEMRQLGDDEKIGSCSEIRRGETTGWWWENWFLFGDPKRWQLGDDEKIGS
jgi:hypothetical protein